MKNKILAVILAGGDSGRFWPFKEKCFFPFLGKPLLYYCLTRLKKAGINDFLVIHTKNNNSLLSSFSQRYSHFSIEKMIQKDPRGMAGAILSVAPRIKDKRILIIGPEEVYEDSLVKGAIGAIKKDTQVLIVGKKTEEYMPGGYLEIENGLIKNIIEKPKEGEQPSNLVNIVFHYYKDSSKLLDYLQKIKSKRDDLYEKTLVKMIKDGVKVNLYSYSKFWGYLKYPWNALDIANFYLSKIKGQNISQSAKIDTRATVKGAVFIGDNVRILEYAKIVGPTYIGRGTVIGNNVMVRKSMIGVNSVVGFASEIGRSYVGNNCWFHTNYVGDSVIGNNVSMGAGSILANLRLDERAVKSKVGIKAIATKKIKLGALIGTNVRIGVNASIMPGIKIGENSFVGAGVVLDRDLPSGKFCTTKSQSYKVKKNKAFISDSFRSEAGRQLRLS